MTFTQFNAAASGGTTLSVAGVNFGIDYGTATVSVSPDACATSSWVAATAVLCRSAASSASLINQDIVVVKGVVAGTMLGTFTFDGVYQS